MTHTYLSTYCFHGQHGDCRLMCKICEAACICACHKDSDDVACAECGPGNPHFHHKPCERCGGQRWLHGTSIVNDHPFMEAS